jgi:phage shock protein PspC (stress-responsive transcriptional regulator)
MPGFVFWGLFVVFGGIVAAYVVWMILTERK